MKNDQIKGIFCLILALMMAFSAVGCGGPEPTEPPTEPPTVPVTEPPTDPTTPSYIPDAKIEGSDLFVKQVDNIPHDFIMGMDASSVIAEEASGVKYYNFEGQ